MAENDRLYISKIKVPSSNVYYLKDEEAREAIEALESAHESDIRDIINKITNGMHFLGTVNSAPTSATVVIGSTTTSAIPGDIVLFGTTEYLWEGSTWEELGDLTALSTDVIVTPSGTIS
ncbi:MAG: hypothetical protein LIR50_11620 [Bacillota bacterium]|nr:hypothetical protein [Bacillota bacterium]